MTKVYFIRHSLSDLSIKDELERPLTEVGIDRAKKLVVLFNSINVDYIFSSPYKRTIQTIEPLSICKKININIVENFRERKISNNWIENFDEYSKKQWDNFSYKLENGESLSEVQNRNIESLKKILDEYNGKTIIIGTHGTALSTIINYYDNTFLYKEFMDIVKIMPYIIRFNFENNNYMGREEIKWFQQYF
jgi:2,3-bisphosphoglycerate-dependent phosphoglycerate mutase